MVVKSPITVFEDILQKAGLIIADENGHVEKWLAKIGRAHV